LGIKQGSQPAGFENDEIIVLGHVSGVYGVKGWLKVYSHADPMESIVEYSPWYIRPGNFKGSANTGQNSGWQPVKLKSGKRHAKTVVAKLEGCNDRDAAQLYVGYEVAILSSQLKSLDHTDEFYWRDLIGLQVVNLQGIGFGEVTAFIETGGNDVLVVTEQKLDKQSDSEELHHEQDEDKLRETLIPWAFGQTIVSVNLETSVIEVDWQDDWNE